jgi:hypothetical protein
VAEADGSSGKGFWDGEREKNATGDDAEAMRNIISRAPINPNRLSLLGVAGAIETLWTDGDRWE